MNIEILLGKTTSHLVPLEGTKFLLNQKCLHDFLKLQRDAREAGFDLQMASAFRDYNRQLRIWNMKAQGEKPVFDDQGTQLDISLLSPKEIMFSILRWSAIPGCSRHHWGTDMDVFDARTQNASEVKLIPAECEGNGPASGLHSWLDSIMSQDAAYGFYRPYRTDRGGVAPERWHLSYHPVSRRIINDFTYSIFKKNLEESDLLLKTELLENAFELYERYFINIDLP
ncbi:MAG TPA: M15 family metallopeptidase [Bacteriovoracaceae bacterium]|nr:M15 family metallopeptidase [Bacteriovoracaceae bacterium]